MASTNDQPVSFDAPVHPCVVPDPQFRGPGASLFEPPDAPPSIGLAVQPAGHPADSAPLPLTVPLPVSPPAPAQTVTSMGGAACGGGPQHPSDDGHTYLRSDSASASITGGAHSGSGVLGHPDGTAADPGARPD